MAKTKSTTAVEPQELFWLSKSELNTFAVMAIEAGLDEDSAFNLFDQDEQGYHFNGARVNASTFKHQFNTELRKADMLSRVSSAVARLGGK